MKRAILYTVILSSFFALTSRGISADAPAPETVPAQPAPPVAPEKSAEESKPAAPPADALPAPSPEAAAKAPEAKPTSSDVPKAPNATAATASAPVPAPAAATKTGSTNATGQSLESFQIIADKNIFNQSRVPRVAGAPRTPSSNEVRRVPKIEVFALVGTMSYGKGDFAFFDSSNGSYRKSAKAGEQIAGYTIQAVTPNQVTLEREGNALEVKVGQQLRREDDGPWQVSARTEAFTGGDSSSGSGSSESGASSASSGSTSGSRSEILKRLLEQRAKSKQ